MTDLTTTSCPDGKRSLTYAFTFVHTEVGWDIFLLNTLFESHTRTVV